MIRAHSNNTLEVETGSLYPPLHRLERAKFIDAKWDRSDKGQRVRVYRLTAAGRKRLAAERTKWERMTQAIAGILNPPRFETQLLTIFAALVIPGLLIGLGGALAVTRLLQKSLFEVTPGDPATFFAVSAVLLFVALIASFAPARRAIRVDPMTALRSD